jgi:L-2-hydroxyglutarate oxidase LhgO
MIMGKTDLIVIGAGVIGLAVAAEISARQPGLSILIMEKHESFGRETSSRNSEVIHAGIYYPAGSLKAQLCVEGNALLYSFCRQWGIAHRRLGKLIVANSPEQVAYLDNLRTQAEANGVWDLEELDTQQIGLLEPNIKAERALFSPTTGIVDTHALMARLEQNALQNGVLPAYCHPVTAIEPITDGYRVHFQNPDGSADAIDCHCLVNCAGLQADRLAALAGVATDQAGYSQHLCKGEYFSLPRGKAALITRLVYPPPLHELAGLGIHATKSLDGHLRLGPNTIYVDDPEDYSVDPDHAAEFFHSVKSFLPFIEPEDLEPEMAGIRPKLSGPGEPFRDFIIRDESDRGLPGLINLIGIESPGLTCCLSIARLVSDLIS